MKNCPFCKSNKIYLETGRPIDMYVAQVHCLECGASSGQVYGKDYEDTKQRAIDKWDRREG